MRGFETMSVGRAAPRNGLSETLVRWRESGEVRDELRMLLVGWGLFESAGGALRPTEAGRVLAQLVWERDAVPVYDAASRRLSWRGQLIKTLHREAACQEAVLLAFQGAGWPSLLADPLPAERGMDVKERLRETVKSLNKRVRRGTVRFHADGTGRAVRWVSVGAE